MENRVSSCEIEQHESRNSTLPTTKMTVGDMAEIVTSKALYQACRIFAHQAAVSLSRSFPLAAPLSAQKLASSGASGVKVARRRVPDVCLRQRLVSTGGHTILNAASHV